MEKHDGRHLFQEYTVEAADEGTRIDRLLSQRFPEASREAWKRALSENEVTMDGQAVSPSFRPPRGSVIRFRIPGCQEAAAPAPEAIPLRILYEDAWLAVIDKPAGMVVHPANGHVSGTLVNAILARYGSRLSAAADISRPGIVHRLDRDTSGVLLIALDDGVHQKLSELFRRHDVERVYDAVVWGEVGAECGVIDVPVARGEVKRKRMEVREGGRRAVTRFERISGNKKMTHLRCSLVTGRTHQIRVHLSYLGFPVVGDPLYGGIRGGNMPEYQLLHASRIAFCHPVTGEPLLVESPLPDRFFPFLDAIGS